MFCDRSIIKTLHLQYAQHYIKIYTGDLFFRQYNEVSLLPEPFWLTNPLHFSVDASDTGCAGFYLGNYFHVELAPDFISTLETHYF